MVARLKPKLCLKYEAKIKEEIDYDKIICFITNLIDFKSE